MKKINTPIIVIVIAIGVFISTTGVFDSLFATITGRYATEAELTHISYTQTDCGASTSQWCTQKDAETAVCDSTAGTISYVDNIWYLPANLIDDNFATNAYDTNSASQSEMTSNYLPNMVQFGPSSFYRVKYGNTGGYHLNDKLIIPPAACRRTPFVAKLTSQNQQSSAGYCQDTSGYWIQMFYNPGGTNQARIWEEELLLNPSSSALEDRADTYNANCGSNYCYQFIQPQKSIFTVGETTSIQARFHAQYTIPTSIQILNSQYQPIQTLCTSNTCCPNNACGTSPYNSKTWSYTFTEPGVFYLYVFTDLDNTVGTQYQENEASYSVWGSVINPTYATDGNWNTAASGLQSGVAGITMVYDVPADLQGQPIGTKVKLRIRTNTMNTEQFFTGSIDALGPTITIGYYGDLLEVSTGSGFFQFIVGDPDTPAWFTGGSDLYETGLVFITGTPQDDINRYYRFLVNPAAASQYTSCSPSGDIATLNCADNSVLTLHDDCAASFPCVDQGATVKCGSDCNPGDAACKSYTEYLECASDGTLPPPEIAPTDFYCDYDIPAIVCELTQRCVEDVNGLGTVQTCPVGGTAYVDQYACPLGCEGTDCHLCDVGTTICEDGIQYSCAADRRSYSDPFTCPNGCGANSCNSLCTPDTYNCIGGVVVQCSPDGLSYLPGSYTCPLGCTESASSIDQTGTCLTCDAVPYICSGNVLQHCTGIEYVFDTDCQAEYGTTCSVDHCTETCTASICVGDDLITCQDPYHPNPPQACSLGCVAGECNDCSDVPPFRCIGNVLERCETGSYVFDTDCTTLGYSCINDQCQSTCTGPYCNGDDRYTCAGFDMTCPLGCELGECNACPGDRCSGNIEQYCSFDGLSYIDGRDCSSFNTVCESGHCTPTCVQGSPDICIADQVYECVASGTDGFLMPGTVCPLGCSNGACISCTGQYRCNVDGSGNIISEVCDSTGYDYMIDDTCESPEYCDGATGRCTTGITCDPGQYVCQQDGNMLLCNEAGDGYVTGDTIACELGCTQGETTCNTCTGLKLCTDATGAILNGDFYYVDCAADGQGWNMADINPCSSNGRTDSVCIDGVCQPVCNPENKYCFVNGGNLFGCVDPYTYTDEPVEICEYGCSVDSSVCNSPPGGGNGGGGGGGSYRKPVIVSSNNLTIESGCKVDSDCGEQQQCIDGSCAQALPGDKSWLWLILILIVGYDLSRKRSILMPYLKKGLGWIVKK